MELSQNQVCLTANPVVMGILWDEDLDWFYSCGLCLMPDEVMDQHSIIECPRVKGASTRNFPKRLAITREQRSATLEGTLS